MFEAIQTYLAEFTYIGIFLVLLLCGLGLPVPEDIPILASGYLAHLGAINVWAALAVNFTGVLLGDTIIYGLGHYWGPRAVEHRLFQSLMTSSRREKVERFFTRHGKKAIFFGRFLAGLRAPLFLMAGIMRVPARTFLGIDTLAATLSVPVLLFAAYFFGDQIDSLRRMVGKTQNFIYLIASVAALMVALRFVIQRRRERLAK